MKVRYSYKHNPSPLFHCKENELQFGISDDDDKVVIKACKNIYIEMYYDYSLLQGDINSLAKKVIKDYHSKIIKESIVKLKIISVKQ
jgi:hypothetical protein